MLPYSKLSATDRRRSAFAVSIVVLLAYSSYAIASGFPPFTGDDSATVTRGGTVSVLDSGSNTVLANDIDIEGDPMLVFLARNVQHGVLTLNRNGTFVYRHNGNNRRKDEFRYWAFDGTGFSRQTKVEIEIVPGAPVAPQIVGQIDVDVDEDQTLRIDLRYLTVIDPDNEYPSEFTIEVNDGQNYTRNGIFITPHANFNGQVSVPVRVNDGTSFSNLFNLTVDVNPINDAPIVVGQPEDQEVIVGTPVSLTFAEYFDDIDSGDSLTYSATGLPPSGSLSINRQTGRLAGTPVEQDPNGSPYNVLVRATDAAGARANVSFMLIIFPNDRTDLEVSTVISANPVTVGETAQWDIRVDNFGPADVEQANVDAQWMTSGPMLSITAPQGCSVNGNDTRSPSIQCSLDGLMANGSMTFAVQGVQNDDGDNSLIATAVSDDDPVLENNSSLTGSQVVAEFSDGPTQILSVSGEDLASGDINVDGLIDVIATTPDQTTIFINNGDRSVLTPGTSLGPDSGGFAVVVLDWNGDGNADVAVAGLNGIAGRVYLNDGTGDLSESVDLDVANSGDVVAAGSADFDGNGFDDLALSGTGGSFVLRSAGGSFEQQALQAGPGVDLSVADVNNDTYPDIVIVDAADRSIWLLQNSGSGLEFGAQTIQRGSAAGVSTADVNSDGSMDLLLAIDGENLEHPESKVLIQQSDGSFPDGNPVGASPLSKMLAGDIDGDAFPDIVALNGGGVHQLYRGRPDGSFELDAEQIVSAGMRRGVLIDFNDDTSLDLIMTGKDAGVVEIHANNGIGSLGLGDRSAPVMTLNGETMVSLASGVGYVDPGATAVDGIDGDLSASVVTSGNFDPNVIGTYTLTYSATDRAGNRASVQRTIQVGVNQGGGGGGALSPVFVLFQMLLFVVVLRRRLVRT